MDALTESQFHTVWTESVGKMGYDKKMFQKVLQSLTKKGLIKKEENKCSSCDAYDRGWRSGRNYHPRND